MGSYLEFFSTAFTKLCKYFNQSLLKNVSDDLVADFVDINIKFQSSISL